jgi:alpha-tubulin suppressor-like RCC1 family protein
MGANLPEVNVGDSAESIVSLALGLPTTCARYDSGNVACWGHRYYLAVGDIDSIGDEPGELPNDLIRIVDELDPRRYSSLSLSSAYQPFGCGISNGGGLSNQSKVRCFGYQLPFATEFGISAKNIGGTLTHVEVPLGSGLRVAEVHSGYVNACAVFEDGRVKCWGGRGQDLGYGSDEWTMDTIGDALPFIDLGKEAVVTTLGNGLTHRCALMSDHRVKCWGQNELGQLGLGDTEVRGDGPGEMGDALPYVDLGSNARALAVGGGNAFSCALLQGGRIKCWGDNRQGQLGLGNRNTRGDNIGDMGDALPFVDLGNGRTAVSMVFGHAHVCALLDDGGVKCWGQNSGSLLGLAFAGALGTGDRENRGDDPGEMGDTLPYVQLW